MGADVRDRLLDLRAEGRSPHTIYAYEVSARKFLASSFGVATRATVRQFMAELAGFAPATLALRLIALRAFFRWAGARRSTVILGAAVVV